MNVLEKIIKNAPLSEEELKYECYKMCDRVHSSCDDECLIYFEGLVSDEELHSGECPVFKSGSLILKALREAYGISKEEYTRENICRIINGQFSWILCVDGFKISFQGAAYAEYFTKHYRGLGYKIIKEVEKGY